VISVLTCGALVRLRYREDLRNATGRHLHRVMIECWGTGPGPNNVLVSDLDDGNTLVVVPKGNLFDLDFITKEDMVAAPKRLGIAKNILGRITELFPTAWPVTMWELDHTLKATKVFKRKIADDGAARVHSGTAGYKTSLGNSPN